MNSGKTPLGLATRLAVLVAVLAVAACSTASAGLIYWDGSQSTAWTDPLNWDGDVAPRDDTTNDRAVFSGTPTANQPAITAARSVLGVEFQSGGWTLGTSGQTLTVGADNIDSTATSGVNTVNCNVYKGSGATTITVSGSTLVFNGTFQYDGTSSQYTYLSGGGTIVFNNTVTTTGRLGISSSQSITLRLGTDISGVYRLQPTATSSAVTLMADNSDRSWGSPIVLGNVGNTPTLTVGDSSNIYSGGLTISGQISSDGGVSKVGNSVLTLSYASGSTYANGTVVNGGTLLVTNTSGSATGTGAVTINNGAVLGGTGIITGATTVELGGRLAPGLIGTVGTLRLGNLDFQTGGIYNFHYSGASSSDLVTAATLTFGSGATLNVSWLGGGSAITGSYPLFTYTGGDPASIGTWTVNAPSGLTGTVSADPDNDRILLTLVSGGGTPADLSLSSGLGANLLRNGVGSIGVTVENAASSTVNLTYSVARDVTAGSALMLLGAVDPTPGSVAPGLGQAHTVSVQSGVAGQRTVQFVGTNLLDGADTASVSVTVNIGNATAGAGSFGAALTGAVAAGAAFDGLASQTVNSLETLAEILKGANSIGANTSVSMAWRSRTATEDAVDLLISDVVRIAGVDAGELYVLQMSYDPSILVSRGTTEAAMIAQGAIFIKCLDNGVWKNAVLGNVPGSNNSTAAQRGYEGTFADFQVAYGTDLSAYVGAWGVYVDNHVAWAVLNHASDFAVVPEPATLGLLAVGGLMSGAAAMRRRRRP